MQLPFTHDQFLDVFGDYNTSLWPAVAVLWLATTWAAVHWLGRGRLGARVVFALLAVHWAWSGVAYHWTFFRSINPAAAVFSGLFLLQAALFTWLALTSRGAVSFHVDRRGIVGASFVVYGIVYPIIGLCVGLRYPRLPLFGVPCPTTLVTAGFLIAATRVRPFMAVLPLLWTVIGGSAAFLLGVPADFALAGAAVVLAVDTLAPSAFGPRQ